MAGAKKLAIGTNCNIKFGFMPSKHAEMDVLNKVKNKKNMPKKIDLMVIRLTKTGLLTESRPCYHCLCFMEKSKLNIQNVYYSTGQGTIVKEKLIDMKSNPKTCISSGMRNLRNWKD